MCYALGAPIFLDSNGCFVTLEFCSFPHLLSSKIYQSTLPLGICGYSRNSEPCPSGVSWRILVQESGAACASSCSLPSTFLCGVTCLLCIASHQKSNAHSQSSLSTERPQWYPSSGVIALQWQGCARLCPPGPLLDSPISRGTSPHSIDSSWHVHSWMSTKLQLATCHGHSGLAAENQNSNC